LFPFALPVLLAREEARGDLREAVDVPEKHDQKLPGTETKPKVNHNFFT